jgi:long-chain acyl-CoA synthetase
MLAEDGCTVAVADISREPALTSARSIDRKKDMIVSSGYKIWPREVEDVLYTHGAIREAAVVGVADAYRGESVNAFISLRPGATLEASEVLEICRTRMAAYKYPRFVEILDDLPKPRAEDHA